MNSIELLHNVNLGPYNSFGINVLAKDFVNFNTVQQLEVILQLPEAQQQLLILGGGSNVLLTADVNALVLHNCIDGMAIVYEDDAVAHVKAGAGVSWHAFVLFCLEHNLGGAENLSLIPGSVGASPMQNIGAYGVELKDIFLSLSAWDIKNGVLVNFEKTDCKFGYRESVFKNELKHQFIIIDVTFILQKKHRLNTSYGAIEAELKNMKIETPTIQDVSAAVIKIRKEKLPDPREIGNAGSFFKNPEIDLNHFQHLQSAFPGIVGYPSRANTIKLAAGWLIEQCGWKGYRQGDAGCHARQALVLVNYGGASGTEILQLAQNIIQSVQQKFDVTLQVEVNVI